MLQHGPRSAPPYLRPLKKKGFKEKRATTIGLYDSGKSTTLESNKSLPDLFHLLHDLVQGYSLAICSRLRQAQQALQQAHERLATCQTSHPDSPELQRAQALVET